MKNWCLILLLSMTILGFSQSTLFKTSLAKAYNFEKNENFKEAKQVFLTLLKEKNISQSEINFSKSYLLFYDYLLSDYSNIEIVEQAMQPLLLIKKRKPYETELLINLYASKCHFEARMSTWEKSLLVAEQGYRIKDFNQAKFITRTDYLYDLGYLYDKTGNSFEGIKFYEKSLALYIKQFGEVNDDVALNYNNLAFAYTNVYNQKNTIAYYNKAATIWEKVYANKEDVNDYLITIYFNLITQYINYGDIGKAKEFGLKLNMQYDKKYKSPLSNNLSANSKPYSTYFLGNVRIYLATNQIDSAYKLLETYSKEQNWNSTTKEDFKNLLQSYVEIIDYLNENKQCQKGLDLGLKSLNIAAKFNYAHYLMQLNSKISSSYNCLNNNELALKYISLAHANNIKNTFNSSKYTLELQKAILLEKSGDKKSPIKLVNANLEQMISDYSKKKKSIKKIQFNDVKELSSTDFIKLFYKSGKIYLNNYKESKDKNDLDQAFKLYKISSMLFKEYYLKGEFNEELNTFHSEITEGLLVIALEKKLTYNDKIELINGIERNASQHLAKEFFQKIKLSNNKNNQTILVIKDLKTELNFYISQKPSTKNTQQIKAIKKNIALLLNQTSKTYQEIEKLSVENFDVQKVQKGISSDEIIVKYYTLKNKVFAVDLTSESIDIKKIGDSEKVKNEVTTFLKRAKSINQDYLASSKTLFKMLNLNQNYKKFTIIPDEYLSYLPFETLFDSKNNQFLIEKHTVSYDYSLPIWFFNKQNKIAVDNSKLIAFSPNYKNKQIAQVRVGLSDLKYAKEEATVISNLFNGKTFLNEKATKSEFFKSLNEFGIFHLSMHSLLYENDFNQSCLVFSNEEKLYFSELYGLNFPAKMVVLSACDTGYGVIKSGEGIMSISRALAFAGVQSSVYSLWQVPDKETSEIMISFYENLKKGQKKDVALATAKNTFIKNNPMKNHPFYWAGFVVNGNTAAVVNSYFLLKIFGAIAGILVLIIVVRKRKSLLKN